MNKNMIKILILATLVILVAAPGSFANSQYFNAMNTVYPGGSCDTCHVNGSSDGLRTAYGTLFENQTNHATDPVAALEAIGAPTTMETVSMTPAATMTMTATMTETMTMTATPEVTAIPEFTTVAATATAAPTAKSPGFGIIVSMVGLIAWALFERRKN